MGQATDHTFLRGYYQQEIPHDPVKQGKCQPGSTLAGQPNRTQPYLPGKNKVHQAGMCAQASASPRLAGRRRILICGLIKARPDYRDLSALGLRALLSGTCYRKTSGLWGSCPNHSLFLTCPGRPGILPRALQGAAPALPTPHPPPTREPHSHLPSVLVSLCP